MTTNIKEMSYSELNTQMENLKAQMQELTSEIQTRKEQVVENYRQHLSQILEDTRLMAEMGIDPTSITIPTDEVVSAEDTTTKGEVAEEPTCEVIFSEEAVKENKAEVELAEPIVSATEEVMPVVVKEPDPSTKEVTVVAKEKSENPLLTPFYYLMGLRKGKYHTVCDRDTDTRQTSKILLPAEQLSGDHINHSLNIGNAKYRKTYPNPDETRIYSADGIAPTLTAMHSDLCIWITDKEHTKDTPPAETASTAA